MSTTNPIPTQDNESLDAVSALAEPNRRALYDYVVSERDWVSRDHAAKATGLRRGIVAHHLDRLAEDGLLEIEHRRLTGRKGPGAGRPAKLYRRASRDVGVSFPPRHYDLAGKVLSTAADHALRDGTPLATAIEQAAIGQGREIGRAGLRRLTDSGDVDAESALADEPSDVPGAADATGSAETCGAATGDLRCTALFSELRRWGFEPETQPDGVTVLHNCPFHGLSTEHTALICGLNLNLLEGVIEGIGQPPLEPRLEPAEDHCCVRFHPAPAAREPAADQT